MSPHSARPEAGSPAALRPRPSRVKRGLPWLVALVVLGLAVQARWRLLPVASALGDAVGPWWVAARGGLAPTPHAPPYGALLAVPYRMLLLGADSLWTATSGLFFLHALVAPIVVLGVRRSGGGLAPAGLAGLAVAASPGLLDTAASGAETYLAPVWVSLVALAVVSRRPMLAGFALVPAVHNHPLALGSLPLLLALPWERRSLWALVGPMLLIPHLFGLALQPLGVGDGPLVDPLPALVAWVQTEGRGAWLAAIALLVGLWTPGRRRVALAVVASVVAVLLLGGVLGYVRDHHLRMLLAPALLGLAGVRLPRVDAWGALVLLPLLSVPEDPVQRPSQARRPGTHGLLAEVSEALLRHPPGPLVLDGVWISSSPAVEPGAALLDLHLRGRGALGVDGEVALVVSAERTDLAALPPGLDTLHRGDRHRVLVGSESEVASWITGLCAGRVEEGLATPRLGGAFDGLVPLVPGLEAERVMAWTRGCDATSLSEGGRSPR